MEEKKRKKKKLTLTASLTKPLNVPRFSQSGKKKSVVIEKKPPKRWGEKKFQSKDNFNKPKPKTNRLNELDTEISIAEKLEPNKYNINNVFPPILLSSQPDGMAPTPNMKALIVTTNPKTSIPTLNSLIKIGIKLGNANINA